MQVVGLFWGNVGLSYVGEEALGSVLLVLFEGRGKVLFFELMCNSSALVGCVASYGVHQGESQVFLTCVNQGSR